MKTYVICSLAIISVLFMIIVNIIFFNITDLASPHLDNQITLGPTYYMVTTDENNLNNPETYIEGALNSATFSSRYSKAAEYKLIYIEEGLYTLDSSEYLQFNYRIPIDSNKLYSESQPYRLADDRYEDTLREDTFYYNIPITDGLIISSLSHEVTFNFQKQNGYANPNQTVGQNGYFIIKPKEEISNNDYSEIYAYEKKNNTLKVVDVTDEEKFTYPENLKITYNKTTDTYINNSDYTLITLQD